jgi:hypothetical protein
LAHIFPRWWNKLPSVAAIAGSLAPTRATAGVWYYSSRWYTDVGDRPVQPIPYSHKLHVGDLGLDCRDRWPIPPGDRGAIVTTVRDLERAGVPAAAGSHTGTPLEATS